VEKVRVNPGNYADKKKFEVIEYSDAQYEAELNRIRERFSPLVKICKEYGTAMRIGTNHGSLSDRIMSRYGDTPAGMVESALEFVRICSDLSFHDIVLSMKSSNPQVMVHAYRLLIAKMKEAGMNYPLHLGVTEAGEGEDGRIKSAAGIGTLMEDGIGDTIRVSLTEDPEFEIPVARALVNRYTNRQAHTHIPVLSGVQQAAFPALDYSKRVTSPVINIGGTHVPVVIANFNNKKILSPASLIEAGYNYSVELDKWNINDQACDYVYCDDKVLEFQIPGTLGLIYNFNTWDQLENKTRCYPLFSAEEYFNVGSCQARLKFVTIDIKQIFKGDDITKTGNVFLSKIQNDPAVVLVFETNNLHGMAEQRRLFLELISRAIQTPVIIKRDYPDLNRNLFSLYAATDAGSLLLDGMGDGIWLTTDHASLNDITRTSFGILQAARTRTSKTEYISCPSCGRTLFDLQETTAKIRTRTNHLKGLKIGIMGCIVNGPGEMADADYGYVGSGPGKITLYKGKEVITRSIDSNKAVDALIDLIKQNGDWVDPPSIN
jgi:(E)-4-hydroxy-3-methylbut-2-enyl-diphosphate synthase